MAVFSTMRNGYIYVKNNQRKAHAAGTIVEQINFSKVVIDV